MPKATPRTLDMSKAVSKGGKFAGKIKHYPEGDYKAIIKHVEDYEAESGNDCYLFGIQVKTALFPYYCVLDAKNLWKLRNLFEAAGHDVPSKKAKLDPNILVGEEIAVTLADDEYDDKVKSVISSVFPLEELNGAAADDNEEDEEEEKPRKKKKPVVEEEDEEEEDEEEEEKPKKKKKKKSRDEDEEDEEEVDEDDL